jgi:integrase
MEPKFTDKDVRDLPSPATGNRIYFDPDVKGFGVRVTPAGAKAFILNYRADGRQRRITIGSFPDWKVAAARDHAKALKRQIDVGEDPMQVRHDERAAPTVKELTERYLAEGIGQKRARTIVEEKSLINQLIIPKLGRLRANAVRRVEVETFHREISASTPTRANRALSLLARIFTVSVGWGILTENPCKGIEKNQEDRRERYLTPAELGRLMAALASHRNKSSANAVRLLLLTGARRGEVLSATWGQFDLDSGVWSKPAASTKQNKLHRVPLSDAARTLLNDMQAAAKAELAKSRKLDPEAKINPALFPGSRDREQQGDLKKFWASLCASAKIEGVRVHDLRHSYASYLASAGLSLPIIGALLGHSQPSTTQRYAHLLDDPLRAATDKVGTIVSNAMITKATA